MFGLRVTHDGNDDPRLPYAGFPMRPKARAVLLQGCGKASVRIPSTSEDPNSSRLQAWREVFASAGVWIGIRTGAGHWLRQKQSYGFHYPLPNFAPFNIKRWPTSQCWDTGSRLDQGLV